MCLYSPIPESFQLLLQPIPHDAIGQLIGYSPPILHKETTQEFPSLWCPNNPYDLNPTLGLPSTLNSVQNDQYHILN